LPKKYNKNIPSLIVCPLMIGFARHLYHPKFEKCRNRVRKVWKFS